jgi:hypothetical protein
MDHMTLIATAPPRSGAIDDLFFVRRELERLLIDRRQCWNDNLEATYRTLCRHEGDLLDESARRNVALAS